MLDNTLHQPPIFRTKNWVEINDGACRTYNKDSQIKFKIWLLKSSLCDYNDAYIIVSGTITAALQALGNSNNAGKEAVFRNWAPFTDCINEVNNARIDNRKDIHVVMLMYSLIE